MSKKLLTQVVTRLVNEYAAAKEYGVCVLICVCSLLSSLQNALSSLLNAIFDSIRTHLGKYGH